MAKEKQTAIFTPLVIRTDNIAKDILSLARSNEIDPSLIDFNILSVQTLVRDKSDENNEFRELDKDEYDVLNEKGFLLNPAIAIKQMYEVELLPAKTGGRLSKLELSIGVNKQITKVYATIRAGSYIANYKELEKELILYVNKKKMRVNILIGVWDKAMYKEISKIVSFIKVNEEQTFKENVTFLISEGIGSILTRNDAIVKHYEKSIKNIDEFDRMDHAKRGFIKPVQEGEVFIEYKKAKMGKPGRNCRGQFIAPREPVIANRPDFSIGPNVEREDTEDSIKYIALRMGYIHYENNRYDIGDEVEVNEITFRSTGSVDAGLNKDIKVNIIQNDVLKDAVGAGMTVEASRVNIEGNIASGAMIKAQDAKIGGQSHQSSKIVADNIDINVHKGLAQGKTVRVTRLENGVIEAENVVIGQTMGGEVRAKEVLVECLGTRTTITASKKIEIKLFEGSENKLIIDSRATEEVSEKMQQYNGELREKEILQRGVEKEINNYEKIVRGNISVIQSITKMIVQYKKQRINPPASMVKKLRDFKEVKEKIENFKIDLGVVKNDINHIKMVRDELQKSIFDTQIINHDYYKGHNEIKFIMLSPKLELSYVPEDGERSEIFEIHRDKDADEEYSIVCRSKKSDDDEDMF